MSCIHFWMDWIKSFIAWLTFLCTKQAVNLASISAMVASSSFRSWRISFLCTPQLLNSSLETFLYALCQLAALALLARLLRLSDLGVRSPPKLTFGTFKLSIAFCCTSILFTSSLFLTRMLHCRRSRHPASSRDVRTPSKCSPSHCSAPNGETFLLIELDLGYFAVEVWGSLTFFYLLNYPTCDICITVKVLD